MDGKFNNPYFLNQYFMFMAVLLTTDNGYALIFSKLFTQNEIYI